MKLQLLKNVRDLGRANSLVEVSDAYARNFLLPKRLAVPATRAVVTAQAAAATRQQRQQHQQSAEMTAAVQRLTGVTVRLHGRASAQGTLFAAVKAETIRQELARQFGLHLPGLRCEPDHLKTIGTHQLTVILADQHRATLTVTIDHAE
ncbi:MAG: 50S ribosomal protein L9 [Patescibacteria group bacterium]